MKKKVAIIGGLLLLTLMSLPVSSAWAQGKPFPTFDEVRQMIANSLDNISRRIADVETRQDNTGEQIAMLTARLGNLENQTSENYTQLIAEIEKIKESGATIPEGPIEFDFNRPNNYFYVDGYSYFPSTNTYTAQLVNDFSTSLEVFSGKTFSFGQGFVSVNLNGKTYNGFGPESWLGIMNIAAEDMPCEGDTVNYQFWYYYMGKLYKIDKTATVDYHPDVYGDMPPEYLPQPAPEPGHCNI